MSDAKIMVKSLEEENFKLKKQIQTYEEKFFTLDAIVEDLNLTGLNKKQIKFVKKYFQERGNINGK